MAWAYRANVYALHLSKIDIPFGEIPLVNPPATILLRAQGRHRAIERVVVLENPRRFGANTTVRLRAAEQLRGEERKHRAPPVFRLDAENHDAPDAKRSLGGDELED